MHRFKLNKVIVISKGTELLRIPACRLVFISADGNYSEVVTDIVNTFMQNDLFASVNVKDISFDNGSATMKVEIQTKYDYKTEKTITV